jgi:hypothetical protein
LKFSYIGIYIGAFLETMIKEYTLVVFVRTTYIFLEICILANNNMVRYMETYMETVTETYTYVHLLRCKCKYIQRGILENHIIVTQRAAFLGTLI